MSDALNPTHQTVASWIKVKPSSKGHGSYQLWRGDKGVGGRIGVITASKIPVVRCDNGVLFSFFDILTIPLTNAWATGICQHCATKTTQSLSLLDENCVISQFYRDNGYSK